MCFTNKTDEYVMGYINAILDTQSSVEEIVFAREARDWGYMYELARKNEGDFADFMGITERGELGLKWELECLMLRYFKAMMIVRELTVSEFADIVHSVEDLAICETPCETRGMIGKSWWKRLGYNSACSCAYEKDKLKY